MQIPLPRHAAAFTIPLLWSSLATAQINTRASNIIDANVNGNGTNDACLVSGDDLTVVIYEDDSDDRIYCRAADGRGLAFGSPVLVDTNGTSARPVGLSTSSCAVFGDTVFAVFTDARAPATGGQPFFNVSTDRGATFGSDVELPLGIYTGGGSDIVGTYSFVAPNVFDLYVLATVRPAGFAGPEELFLISSHDSGQSWTSVRVDSNVPSVDVDLIDIDVDPASPLEVHLVWTDDRAGGSNLDDVFYRKSADGGATFTAPEQQLDSSGALSGHASSRVRVEADAVSVGVGWLEDVGGGGQNLRFALSLDGGTSFAPDIQIGGYAQTDDLDVFDMGLVNSFYVFAWDDNRTSPDSLYTTFAPVGVPSGLDTQLATNDGAVPTIITDEAAGLVAVTYQIDDTTTTSNQIIEVAWSDNGAATWEGPFPVSDLDPIDNDSFAQQLAFNPTYHNFVSMWKSDEGGFPATRKWRVGGFRPQTCDPIGWDDIHNPTSTTLGFDLRGFGSNTITLVGLSSGAGPILAPDGRLFDLGPSIGPFGGFGFEATLISGSGTTALLPNVFAGGVPIGITVHFAAAGFNSSTAGLITDSFTFDL